MTSQERKIASALKGVTFLPGHFDKRFVRQLNFEKDMTVKGRAFMIKLLHKYRRQIHNYQSLNGQLTL